MPAVPLPAPPSGHQKCPQTIQDHPALEPCSVSSVLRTEAPACLCPPLWERDEEAGWHRAPWVGTPQWVAIFYPGIAPGSPAFPALAGSYLTPELPGSAVQRLHWQGGGPYSQSPAFPGSQTGPGACECRGLSTADPVASAADTRSLWLGRRGSGRGQERRAAVGRASPPPASPAFPSCCVPSGRGQSCPAL